MDNPYADKQLLSKKQMEEFRKTAIKCGVGEKIVQWSGPVRVEK